jgi:hypothetical protein
VLEAKGAGLRLQVEQFEERGPGFRQ